MIQIDIPGRKMIKIEHVVLDYNGTVAVDGKLLPEARERIAKLREKAAVHILTADTYGTVCAQCGGLADAIDTFPSGDAAQSKAKIVRALSGGTACFGNGYNDILMLDAADLSVAVMLEEGMCAALLSHADVAVKSIADGLDLLLCPDRLRATLRA